jgi:hypothetical protein
MPGDDTARITVTNIGVGVPIRGVSARFVTNKVVFDNRFTLRLQHYIVFDAYSAPTVASGESFTVGCHLTWSMWMNDVGSGFFAFGEVRPDTTALAIGFTFKNGILTLDNTGGKTQIRMFGAFGFKRYPVTAVDGNLIVRYNWPFSLFPCEKIIHVIGTAYDGATRWRLAPESEPTVLDAKLPGGFSVTATGSPDRAYGLTATMDR